jgi:hypothetical protein
MSELACEVVSVMPSISPLEAKAILHRLATPWRRDVTAPNVTIYAASIFTFTVLLLR